MFVMWLTSKQWGLYLQQMNMEADQLCKITKDQFGENVYFSGEYMSISSLVLILSHIIKNIIYGN